MKMSVGIRRESQWNIAMAYGLARRETSKSETRCVRHYLAVAGRQIFKRISPDLYLSVSYDLVTF